MSVDVNIPSELIGKTALFSCNAFGEHGGVLILNCNNQNLVSVSIPSSSDFMDITAQLIIPETTTLSIRFVIWTNNTGEDIHLFLDNFYLNIQ